jgi:hypothetical protein
MSVKKIFDAGVVGWLTNAVGNVNRKKIRVGNESIDRLKSNMVGIDMIRFVPTQRQHRCVGFSPRIGRVAAHKSMFAIRFIPDGNEFRPELRGQQAGLQLRPALHAKAITHAKGEFTEG